MTHTIPPVVHIFWDGPPLPEQFRGFPTLWRELNPGWSLEWWTDERVRDEVLPGSGMVHYYTDNHYWSPKSNVWQWRSDLARYLILNRAGGVWVDADLEPLKSIEPLRRQADVFAAKESAQWVNNAFIGCPPGHSFIRDVVNGLPDRVRRNRQQRVNRSIGARYLTGVVARHPEVLVLAPELVYPFSCTELHRRAEDFPGAYTKHHWWNRTKAQKAHR